MNKKIDEEFKNIHDEYLLQCICTEMKDKIIKLKKEKEQLKVWLKDLIDKNNDIYQLYKNDILHHDYEINNVKYQNNIFLAILEKIENLEDNKNESFNNI